MVKYVNIDHGNEELAAMVGVFDYTQEQFEHIQKTYNIAKTIKNKYVITANKTKTKNCVSFRLIEKDDPIGFVLNNITSTSKRNGNATSRFVDDAYKNQNAGFLIFEIDDFDEFGRATGAKKILAQTYVWYDPNTSTVCYDRIEIPKDIIKELNNSSVIMKETVLNELINVITKSAMAISNSMSKKGHHVSRVTAGPCILNKQFEDAYGDPEQYPIAKHRTFNGETNAQNEQYLIVEQLEKTMEKIL